MHAECGWYVCTFSGSSVLKPLTVCASLLQAERELPQLSRHGRVRLLKALPVNYTVKCLLQEFLVAHQAQVELP
jgi:hypothetical protein